MQVYFDNAATTPLDPEVFDAMKPFMIDHYGNPSSIHSHGRQARSAVEKSRRTIAELLNTSPAEIFFTSGGTEADNTAINCSLASSEIDHIVTSKIEHHAVLHTVERLEQQGTARVSYVDLDRDGSINYDHLQDLISQGGRSLVTLMHANNEIGNLTDLQRVGEMCRDSRSVFHSDTVQAMAHYRYDLQQINIQCILGSAHKFHGPKGVGFLYVQAGHSIGPFIHGGSQERNMRGGTENVAGIVGLAKAMELAYFELDQHHQQIQKLKQYMIDQLKSNIPGITFNGLSDQPDKSLYTVLSISLPASDDREMLLFNLDISGISASGGSACTSGSNIGSHVLEELGADPERSAIRFSFSKYNTREEVDYVVQKLAALRANDKSQPACGK